MSRHCSGPTIWSTSTIRCEFHPIVTKAIEIEGLHVRFGDGDDAVEALRDVTFSVRAGERVAIIGRSGGGKSTLLRVLAGLLAPTEGHVRVEDRLLGPDDRANRSFYGRVGMVFQDYGLVPQLTAMQNVLCGGFHDRHFLGSLTRFKKSDHQRAEKLLRELGLRDRLHVRASRLSGGEQQRVAIARLLFQAPAIRLLDEPVASLDVHWANQAIELLAGEDAPDSTVVMVLHDLAMARRFADRVILVREGQIAFDGDPEEACRRLEAIPSASSPPSADGHVGEEMLPPDQSGPVTALPPSVGPTVSPEAGPTAIEDSSAEDQVGGLWAKTSFYVGVAAAVVVLYVWAALGVEFSLSRIFDNLGNAVDFGGRMFPPDFEVSATVAHSLIETVQMALIGTTLAAFLSLPLAVLAARNISARPLQAAARLILNTLRTIPSIIWGLFFVAIVGLGPFPGILALTFYAAGYLGKFYYEGIESIDGRPLQSLRTVGASSIQQFRWGVFPQVLPLMLGYTLYMFEYNVRAASILGIVGAGGIGFYLYAYIQNFQYDRAATALLFLLVVVTIIDALSSRLRARLMA